MSLVSEHAEWLSLLDISGPFLTLPVLVEKLPNGLDILPKDVHPTLKLCLQELNKRKNNDKAFKEFSNFVLKDLLGFTDDNLINGLKLGYYFWDKRTNSQVKADYALVPPAELNFDLDAEPVNQKKHEPKKACMLIMLAPHQDLAPKRPDQPAQAARQMEDLLRKHGVALGLIISETHCVFVSTATNRTTTFVTWYVQLWLEERITLQAFVTLLSKRRFSSLPSDQTLQELMLLSADRQQAVTDSLGMQVRSALSEFISAIDRLEDENTRNVLKDISPAKIYEAGLVVMMRLVFLLSAEERGLLRLGDPLWDKCYAASRLCEELRNLADRQGEEVLLYRRDAWFRLLALFRAVYAGVTHQDMLLKAYGGSLFDPDSYPFLEGRATGSTWRDVPAKPLNIDDRVILHMLEAVQFLSDKRKTGVTEAVRLSFRSLDVEQIGHVYEGLLDRTCERAQEVLLGIQGGNKNHEPFIPLSKLQQLRLDGEDLLIKYISNQTGNTQTSIKQALYDQKGRGRKKQNLDPQEERLKQAEAERLNYLLLDACRGDQDLVESVKPFVHILRRDSFGRPIVVPKGSIFVTAGTQRRDTGTHYTPRRITEQVVAATLKPHVYHGVNEGKPEDQWLLKSPDEILSLRVCDMTMGSGAFLVATCRYLAERLTEAWQEAGTKNLPTDKDERLVLAKRMVADKCLYGVDNNPMAVEMSKLSLWLTTMQKDKPFSFLDHSLRFGDAIMGVTNFAQLCYGNFEGEKQVQLQFASDEFKKEIAKALNARNNLGKIFSDSPIHIFEKSACFDKAQSAIENLRRIADALIIGYVENNGLLSQSKMPELIQEITNLKDDPQKFDAWLKEKTDRIIFGSDEIKDRSESDFNPAFTKPFHWLLEFPEIFDTDDNPGFDVIVGNPPFKGANNMRADLGGMYREYIVNIIGHKVRGLADLSVYFFLRANDLVRNNGDFGLIATNTIAQGESRKVGLAQLLDQNCIIRTAWPDVPWEGNAAVCTSQIILRKQISQNIQYKGEINLDNRQVEHISSFLKNDVESWEIQKLKVNNNLSFIGTFLLGDGFLISKEQADTWIKIDQRNKDILFPYLCGDDVANHPRQIPSRYVINFFDWDEEKAKTYTKPYLHLEEYIKPFRQRTDENGNFISEGNLSKIWWIFKRNTLNLYHQIGRGDNFDKHPKNWKPFPPLKRVLVVPRHSKYGGMIFVPNTYVMNEALCIFSSDQAAFFGIIQSSIHQVWAWKMCSTMGASTLRYTPSSCFETFPRPTTNLDPIEECAENLHELRALTMEIENIGLTVLYNKMHDPEIQTEYIVKVRSAHEELDKLVAKAYGWDDLDMSHDFRKVAYLPDSDNIRHTISEEVRLEIIKRLTQLNKIYYENEQNNKNKKEKCKKISDNNDSGSNDTNNGDNEKSVTKKHVQQNLIPKKKKVQKSLLS
ncbi:MAG: hypothetical protein IJT59_06220 [Desulfovibrionaceae bacterium]|nr:hypothetical protein [Desulfovibrionaceae bacterium]